MARIQNHTNNSIRANHLRLRSSIFALQFVILIVQNGFVLVLQTTRKSRRRQTIFSFMFVLKHNFLNAGFFNTAMGPNLNIIRALIPRARQDSIFNISLDLLLKFSLLGNSYLCWRNILVQL